MRIVYDDTMQDLMVDQVSKAMSLLDVRACVRYEYGMERVQQAAVRQALERALAAHRMTIGRKAEHAAGIGNNCAYAVYYRPEDADELQQCGTLCINHGLYGEVYVNCKDYDGKLVSDKYEITKTGIKANGRWLKVFPG